MFNQQMMMQNPQFGQRMMGCMVGDPALRQQMFETMIQNPHFMQQWMGDEQFQQEWMYPCMMQNWMMGGPMLNYGTDTSASPAVMTDRVVIPQNAWNPGSTAPYQPLRIEVQAGTTVTWINPNESWSYTFDDEGEYNYYCITHLWMRGTVEVE